MTDIENKNPLNSSEVFEKLVLDFAYLKHDLINSIEDKKLIREAKKKLAEYEEKLSKGLNVDVSEKIKQDYINLKTSNFDKDTFRIMKYLE